MQQLPKVQHARSARRRRHQSPHRSPHQSHRRRVAGFTLTEMMVVVGIIGVMAAIAAPALVQMQEDQRVKSAARSVADAFRLGRSEAIRTGSNVIVVFIDANGPGNLTLKELSQISGVDIADPIVVVNDGPSTTANCMIDSGEILHTFKAQEGVSWGTTSTVAGNTAAPTDQGSGTTNVAQGSSFTNATQNPGARASWVVFSSDGLPHTFTPTNGGGCTAIGTAGLGGGSIYVTNGRRDFAASLSPLGSVRLHGWAGTAWRQ